MGGGNAFPSVSLNVGPDEGVHCCVMRLAKKDDLVAEKTLIRGPRLFGCPMAREIPARNYDFEAREIQTIEGELRGKFDGPSGKALAGLGGANPIAKICHIVRAVDLVNANAANNCFGFERTNRKTILAISCPIAAGPLYER